MGVFKDQEAADGAIKVAVDEYRAARDELMQNALGKFRGGRPGEGHKLGSIAQALTKAEVAAGDAGIASVIQAHIDAGYRNAEEIRKRVDDEFIGKVMTTTGAVSLSKSGRGSSSNDLRIGESQRVAFDAAKNRLRTGLKARIVRELGKPRTDTLLRRLIRRFEDHPATALVLLAVGVVLGGWKLVELGFQAVDWITK